MAEVKSVAEIIESVSPYYQKKKAPEAVHKMVYDSSSETLEPLYFFILDLMNGFGLAPKKYVDNFSSTPGSGHFGDMGQRATVMQQNAEKLLGDSNTVLRSILNLVYDLKEFKMRLQQYDDLKSKKKEEQEASLLALKQIWMDKVDFAKGNSSIKAMAFGQSGFQTLIDAFLIAKDEKLKGLDGKELDLNDRVKRIIRARIVEFNIWLTQSERELRKRFELEKTYLKSQVNSLKLYSRWIRPYLKAASDLENKERFMEPALVKTFDTILLELTLLGKSKTDIADEVLKGNFPTDFAKEKFLSKLKRNYYTCILVDFNFRGIPQKISQQSHYVFGGRAEITFKAYALNDDELKKLDEEFNKSEMNDVLSMIEGTTNESLGEIKAEIDEFLEEKPVNEKSKDNSNPFAALFGKYDDKSKPKDTSNPFSALFGRYDKTVAKPGETIVAPDDWIEANHFRPITAENAKTRAFDIFDTYKKSHGMSSFT
jgi:hypothetical protein